MAGFLLLALHTQEAGTADAQGRAGLAWPSWRPAPWGSCWPLVGTPRARRQSPCRRPPVEPQGDGLPWPGLRQQQALLAGLEAGEQIAAAERAQVLVSQGFGALQGWLTHPGQHPGEPPARASHREPAVRRNHHLLGLFDAA